jgi:hypothetical protein
MATQAIALAILVITCIIGVWKKFSRIQKEKRRLADEAKTEYEEAVKSGDVSRISAALNRINRL